MAHMSQGLCYGSASVNMSSCRSDMTALGAAVIANIMLPYSLKG